MRRDTLGGMANYEIAVGGRNGGVQEYNIDRSEIKRCSVCMLMVQPPWLVGYPGMEVILATLILGDLSGTLSQSCNNATLKG